MTRRLPEHLEFVMHNGEMIQGTGPYTVFLLDRNTGKKHRLFLRSPEGGTVKEFMAEFERALKEQLNVTLREAETSTLAQKGKGFYDDKTKDTKR